jgi:hypothetical protein
MNTWPTLGDRPPLSPSASIPANGKRKYVRYRITGVVSFEWLASDGQRCNAIGITRDIGRGGVFIKSTSIPPLASEVKLAVRIPSQSNPKITLQLEGRGLVRHVLLQQYPTSGFGVSAVFTWVPRSNGNG